MGWRCQPVPAGSHLGTPRHRLNATRGQEVGAWTTPESRQGGFWVESWDLWRRKKEWEEEIGGPQ